VLRAKVSVFVELWTKTQQLQASGETARTRDNSMRAAAIAVDEAVAALRSAEATDGALAKGQLDRAQAALTRARRHLG
jgi:hypothetical protein